MTRRFNRARSSLSADDPVRNPLMQPTLHRLVLYPSSIHSACRHSTGQRRKHRCFFALLFPLYPFFPPCEKEEKNTQLQAKGKEEILAS